MKITKTASGSQMKISRSEWESIGKKAGWAKTAKALEDSLVALILAYPPEMIVRGIMALEDHDSISEEDIYGVLHLLDEVELKQILESVKQEESELELSMAKTKKKIKMSKKQWQSIGKKAGWIKAEIEDHEDEGGERIGDCEWCGKTLHKDDDYERVNNYYACQECIDSDTELSEAVYGSEGPWDI